MKILDVDQRSIEWVKARFGKVTASELDNLLSPEWKLRAGETPFTYVSTKAAEAWRGEPLPGFGSWATDQGTILEDEALPWFSLQFDTDVRRVGFIVSDDGRSGCSPDGLIGDTEGIEIKCPQPHTHVSYLRRHTEVPKDYRAQIHMGMFVTGFKKWRFISYCRKFPAVVIEVHRDEEICKRIGEAVAAFAKEFDATMALIKQHAA